VTAVDADIVPDDVRSSLEQFEGWLDGDVDVAAATPLATEWALDHSGIDVAAALADARLYVDAYPFEGRIVGDIDQRCGRWLAERIAMFVEPADCTPRARAAITDLAAAIEDDLPAAAASFRGVAERLDDQELWSQLALRVAQRELRSGYAGYHHQSYT
jgi:hypothetical protein